MDKSDPVHYFWYIIEQMWGVAPQNLAMLTGKRMREPMQFGAVSYFRTGKEKQTTKKAMVGPVVPQE